jgi:hypothetical protein
VSAGAGTTLRYALLRKLPIDFLVSIY